MYFMDLSQSLESWSGHGLPYWSEFLKWNPGGKVWSGTRNESKYVLDYKETFRYGC